MNDKEKNFISAVVYCYNCGVNVAEFLTGLQTALNVHFDMFEIICVNDCSTDNTVQQIKEAGLLNVTVINTSFHQGLEAASIAAVDLAIGDFVLQIDDTNKDYDTDLLYSLYQKSLKGHDIVFAVPSVGVHASSKIFYSLFNRFSDYEYKIKTSNLLIVSRRAINRMKEIGIKTVYRKAVCASAGLRIGDVDYQPIGRAKHNVATGRVKRELATNSLILFTDIAYKVSIFLCAAMIALLIFSTIYIVVIWLLGDPVAGWTTTMALLSFGFFGLFLILTFIVKYMSLILNLVFSRKEYLVENIERFNKD